MVCSLSCRIAWIKPISQRGCFLITKQNHLNSTEVNEIVPRLCSADTGFMLMYVVEHVFRCLAALGNPTSSALRDWQTLKAGNWKELHIFLLVCFELSCCVDLSLSKLQVLEKGRELLSLQKLPLEFCYVLHCLWWVIHDCFVFWFVLSFPAFTG